MTAEFFKIYTATYKKQKPRNLRDKEFRGFLELKNRGGLNQGSFDSGKKTRTDLGNRS